MRGPNTRNISFNLIQDNNRQRGAGDLTREWTPSQNNFSIDKDNKSPDLLPV